ncbi:intercellular adhesion molecule 1-like [Pongo abelii]|uniref:intercellular adhesion molecule 1-like n=1 Tax=Pongo abelii TaxID=9601 RepID=UPI00300428C4
MVANLNAGKDNYGDSEDSRDPWGNTFIRGYHDNHGPEGRTEAYTYKPRLEESSCSGKQTWLEGMEYTLACVPKGNPAPALVCTWNGVVFDLEVPQKATQNHTGTYCCTATNQLGSVSKDIAVIVQGLDEGISSTLFVIITVALGVCVITIALYLSYRPCKVDRRKLLYRQKE